MKIISAIKLIYPTINGGFSYWETKYDGTPLDNPIDGLVWENAEFKKPTWDQIASKLDFVVLEEIKKNKIIEIESSRSNFIYLPIEYNGSTFINSEKSSTSLKIAKDETNEPIEWLDIYGNQVDLTKIQAGELLSLMFNHRKSAYFQEASKIREVLACESVEQVEAVNIEFI